MGDDAFASQIIPGCGSMKECRENLVQDYINKERGTFEMLAKASIGVAEIQKLENIAVSDEQLNDEVNTIQKELEQQGENPDADGIKQMIKERLESQMVFEWLEKHCEVEYV